jgi:ribosomal protein S18 acetylase RimI-like enzyme
VEIREDGWLAAIVGHPVYRLEGDLAGAGPRVAAHAGSQPAALYYARVDTDRVEEVRGLTAAGFAVVDVGVTLGREAREAPPGPGPARPGGAAGGACGAPGAIRAALPEDHEAAVAIAARCFRYSRFHLDPRIGRGVADRIKGEWVRSYVRKQRGEALYVALAGGRPAGFLAVLAAETGSRRVRVIDLIGVDAPAQGRGIGEALVRFFVDRYREECDELRVGTQAANVPSLRLYEKCGFRVVRTQYVLHLHAGAAGGADR